MRASKRIALGLALALFSAWCAMRFRAEWKQVSFPPLAHSILIVVLALALSLVNYLLRAVRWSIYLKRRGHSPGFGFGLVAYVAGFAFAISPAKLGELARARYYKARGTPLGELAAVSIVERLIDVAAMLVLATLVLAAFPSYSLTVVLIAVAAFMGGALVLWLPWSALATPTHPRSKVAFLNTLVRNVALTLHAARSLLRPQYVFVGLVMGLIAWSAEGVGFYLFSTMFGPASIPIAAAVGIYALATLVGAATFVPGGLIGTEATMAGLLVASGYPAPDALLITLASRFSTLWFAVALGWLAVFSLEARTPRRSASMP
jgi:uncharacterized protein (TIRG00374 family)